MVGLGEDLSGRRGNNLGRVPWAFYEQVFFGQGPRVPRAEKGNNDNDGIRGQIHWVDTFW